MRRPRTAFSTLALVLLLAPSSLRAQSTAAASKRAAHKLPVLIDRELLFGNPEISGARISPDGRFIAFRKPYHGTMNIWVKGLNESFDAAHPITADTVRPVRGYFWSRDGKAILFAQDKGGDENFNIYAVDPAAPAAPGRAVPEARDLTRLTGVAVQVVDLPRSDPDILYLGLNDRDKAWHDLYKLKISTGERTLVRKNTDRVVGWVFDHQGNLRLAARSTDKGDTEILRVDPAGMTTVYTANVFESVNPVGFHPDGKRIYLSTNVGNVDLERLVLFDPVTKQETLVESDPKGRVDFGGAIISERTDSLLGTTYNDERSRVYWRDSSFARDYRLLQRRFPGREIGFGSATSDERRWLVTASSDVEPGETWLFDRDTKALTLQYRVRPRLPRAALSPMRAISYPSSDGLSIPAYLTLPLGVSAKGLPLVVVPHGGPWARDHWGTDGIAQFLANRGYAVLQPNFRSSTGYGKKFLNAGNNEWGQKMQDDITWGVKHLVAQGTVDPKRVGILGGSYGGYATLAGVAFTPDLYAAAVAIVAPSNLITLLETIPPYWEAGRVIFYTRMGNPNTPEGKAQLMRQSPLSSVSKIHTPLMVVQGANDPRVNKRESDQIVVALRDRGFPVEYIVAPDEGHGFARPVNNMAMFMAAEHFLAKHLGGRYQEGGTPEVTKRLGEITVDPKTVIVAPRLTASVAPVPASDLAPMSMRYQGTIVAGGQTMAITSTTTVVAHPAGGWAISERSTLPMGSMVDSSRLESRTLVPRERTIAQGPVQIALGFTDSKAAGTFSMNGQSRPIAADLDGPLFGDGAGAFLAIARLPLADGYRTTIRNFDVQKAKSSLKQVAVLGSETASVPAGSFTAWKVQVTDEGGGNPALIWVDKATSMPVKIVASQGPATITMELAK